MSIGKFSLTHVVVLLLLVIVPLALIFWASRQSTKSDNASARGASVVSTGTAVPPTSPTPQGTRTPRLTELSPVVINLETAEALGFNPTPGPTARAKMEEGQLVKSLYTRPGVVIAQGTNSTPTADGITSYRIEEVIMTGTATITWLEERVTFDRFWRLTVTGPTFGTYFGSLRYTIWIDQNLLAHGNPRSVPGEVRALAFDRSLLPEGATITVSQFNSVSISSQVPERIHYLTTSPQFQETITPRVIELSPAVSNMKTVEAEGGYPTPNATQLAQMQEAQLVDSLYTRPGTLIAQGMNTTPTADGLTTYRIEEVAMPGPTTINWGNNVITFERFWRLTIIGRMINPHMGSLGYSVWIDSEYLEGGNASEGEVTAITFDRSLLPEGGRIGVGAGELGAFLKELPETIHYNR